MHRTLLPKTLTLLLLAMVSSAGQTKPSGEVDPVKCWMYPTGETSGEMLASDGAQIFIGIDGGKVEALSPDGKKVWSSDLGGEIRSNENRGENLPDFISGSGRKILTGIIEI